jgi:hypothetical protein
MIARAACNLRVRSAGASGFRGWSALTDPHGPIDGPVPLFCEGVSQNIASAYSDGYQIKAFAVASKTPILATRRKVASGVMINEPLSLVGETTSGRIVLTADSGGVAPDPSLGANDWAFIELAVWDVTAGPVITQTFDPDNLIWSFAGEGVATAPHAAQHDPDTGGDPLPLASSIKSGLLAKTLYPSVLGAVQDVTSATACLGVTTDPVSESNLDGPVTKELTLSLAASLNVNAENKLAVSHPTVGGINGTSSLSSRHGHGHTEAALPTKIDNYYVLTSAFSGSTASVTVPVTGFTRIDNVRVFWQPRKVGGFDAGALPMPLIPVDAGVGGDPMVAVIKSLSEILLYAAVPGGNLATFPAAEATRLADALYVWEGMPSFVAASGRVGASTAGATNDGRFVVRVYGTK